MYVLLNVSPYSFKDEEGQQRDGLSVFYQDLDMPAEEGAVGHQVLQISADADLAPHLTKPGVYEFSFGQRRGVRGRPQLVMKGAKLLKPLTYPAMTSGGAVAAPETSGNSSK